VPSGINQAAEAVRDYPILDCGGVLEGHRDPRAVMAHARHQGVAGKHTEDAQPIRRGLIRLPSALLPDKLADATDTHCRPTRPTSGQYPRAKNCDDAQCLPNPRVPGMRAMSGRSPCDGTRGTNSAPVTGIGLPWMSVDWYMIWRTDAAGKSGETTSRLRPRHHHRVPAPRPRLLIHQGVRRGLHRRRHSGPDQSARSAPGERDLRTDDWNPAPRIARQDPGRQRTPSTPDPHDLPASFQYREAAERATPLRPLV
jgi:hypothetical protein